MKIVIADSNSIIYLTKSGMLSPFVKLVRLIITEQVVQECLGRAVAKLPDARFVQGLIQEKSITVQNALKKELADGHKLGCGEKSVIRLYYEIAPATVLTDDGEAVKYCRRKRIAYISSPFVPVVLYENEVLGLEEAHRAIQCIGKIGYFSKQVLDHANNRLFV